MNSQEYIKGTIKTIVLKLLSDNKRMYGYEITQKVGDVSKGQINLTYGALYPILYKVEGDVLVVASSGIVEGRARKYYSLTKSGNETAAEKVVELERFIELLKGILAPASTVNFKIWPA